MFSSRGNAVISRLFWAITILICVLYYARFGKESYNFYGDALGYYMYLPSTFIYHNHKSIETLPKNRGIRPFIHGYAAQMGNGQRTPKGYVLNQYTYGIAFMEAPFFFLAHGWEKMTGGLANGFSQSYRLAIDLSTMVYAILGLWIVYKVLRRRYSALVSNLSTALLLIGTNLFWFTLYQGGMSHVPLFFLFALLLYLTDKVYSEKRMVQFICLGLVIGLVTVIRPIDGLCFLVPVLYYAEKPFLKAKIEFVRKHVLSILIAGLCVLIPIIPQIIYWKWLTGYSIYDSYGPNQRFDFLHSHVWAGIFGPSNGWLFYTPIMVLSLFGFLYRKKWRSYVPGISLFLVLYIWCIYSWYIPNYINGLGSRPMVDVYPILALPFAAFLERLLIAKNTLRVIGFALLAICVFINLNYSVKRALGLLNSDDSKYMFNLSTFFRYHLTYDDLVVRDIGILQPNEKGLHVTKQKCISLEDSVYSNHVVVDSIEHKKVYAMHSGEEYGPMHVKMDAQYLASKKHSWIRCFGRFRTTYPEIDIYQNQLLVLQIRRGDKTMHWYGVRINNKVGLLENDSSLTPALGTFRNNIWGVVRYYVPVPEDIEPSDTLQLDIWNIGRKPIFISGLCMSICDEE